MPRDPIPPEILHHEPARVFVLDDKFRANCDHPGEGLLFGCGDILEEVASVDDSTSKVRRESEELWLAMWCAVGQQLSKAVEGATAAFQ